MPTLHQAAREEVRSAAAWYEEQVIGLGHLLLEEVDHALEKIDTFPRAGSPWRHEGVDRSVVRAVSLRRFPYRIYYVLKGPAPHVVAFARSAQEPDGSGRVDDSSP